MKSQKFQPSYFFNDFGESHFLDESSIFGNQDSPGHNLALDYGKLLTDLCSALNVRLKKSPIKTSMSGSTGVLILVHGSKIIAGNVGDSRAALILDPRASKTAQNSQNSKKAKLTLKEITRDLTPYVESERRRISESGGIVRKIVSKSHILELILKFSSRVRTAHRASQSLEEELQSAWFDDDKEFWGRARPQPLRGDPIPRNQSFEVEARGGGFGGRQ